MRETRKSVKAATNAEGLSALAIAEIAGGYTPASIRWRAKKLAIVPDIVLPNGCQYWSLPRAAAILAAIRADQRGRREKLTHRAAGDAR